MMKSGCNMCNAVRSIGSLIGWWLSKNPNQWRKDISDRRVFQEGLPWWFSGWESTCHFGECKFNLWSERIPHAAGQLGLCVTTTEPQLLSACSRAHRLQLLSPCTPEPVLCNKRSYHNEKPLHSNESSPHSLQLEKVAATKTQSSQKKKKKKKK